MYSRCRLVWLNNKVCSFDALGMMERLIAVSDMQWRYVEWSKLRFSVQAIFG